MAEIDKSAKSLSLKDVKVLYKSLRNDQRTILKNYLCKNKEIKELGLNVKGGGYGHKTYSQSNRIKAYDLSNWRWIELVESKELKKSVESEKSFSCVISLNMPETDPGSGNNHALFDRIGIFTTYKKNGCFYNTEIYTDIDLPFSDVSMKKILGIVVEQYKASNC